MVIITSYNHRKSPLTRMARKKAEGFMDNASIFKFVTFLAPKNKFLPAKPVHLSQNREGIKILYQTCRINI